MPIASSRDKTLTNRNSEVTTWAYNDADHLTVEPRSGAPALPVWIGEQLAMTEDSGHNGKDSESRRRLFIRSVSVATILFISLVAGIALLWWKLRSPDSQSQRPSYPMQGINTCIVGPQGRRAVVVARSRPPQNGRDLVVVDLQEGTVRRLAKGGHPGWSPDGTGVAFLGKVGDRIGLFYVDIETGDIQPYSWARRGALRLVESPTSQLLAVLSFCGDRGEGGQCLSIVRPDGTDRRVLATWRAIYPTMKWGPGGRHIYLVGFPRRSSPSQVGRIRVDDGSIEFLVEGPVSGAVALSEDGSRLCYMQDLTGRGWEGKLWLLDTISLQKTPIPDPPATPRCGEFDCSPLGDAVAVGDLEGGLWRIEIASGQATLVADQGYMPAWLPKDGQGFIYFRLASPQDRDSDILMYHSNDAGTEQRLVARF